MSSDVICQHVSNTLSNDCCQYIAELIEIGCYDHIDYWTIKWSQMEWCIIVIRFSMHVYYMWQTHTHHNNYTFHLQTSDNSYVHIFSFVIAPMNSHDCQLSIFHNGNSSSRVTNQCTYFYIWLIQLRWLFVHHLCILVYCILYLYTFIVILVQFIIFHQFIECLLWMCICRSPLPNNMHFVHSLLVVAKMLMKCTQYSSALTQFGVQWRIALVCLHLIASGLWKALPPR